jgi:hypothetical protein
LIYIDLPYRCYKNKKLGIYWSYVYVCYSDLEIVQVFGEVGEVIISPESVSTAPFGARTMPQPA